jgi:hypothetical protein
MRLVHQGGEEALPLAPDEGTAKAVQDNRKLTKKIVEPLSFIYNSAPIIAEGAPSDIRHYDQNL